jgi:hypothetical protein
MSHPPPAVSRAPSRVGAGLVALAGTLVLASCVSGVTDNQLDTVAGEWCTLRGLASSNAPVTGIPFVGMVIFSESGQVFGQGSVSRPDDEAVIPSRYEGTVTGRSTEILRTDLQEEEEPGPVFTLSLTLDEGGRDLVGTMSGDPEFEGAIHLVRLGPRCFAD